MIKGGIDVTEVMTLKTAKVLLELLRDDLENVNVCVAIDRVLYELEECKNVDSN